MVGRDKPQQTGGHAQDQRNSEHESPTVGAVQAVLSARQAPQLCQLAESPPRGDAWISEINFDGYRLLVFLTGGKVRILSRNALDWTTCLLAHAIAQLRVDTAVLDGELVALKANGLSSFADLQRALSEGRDSRLSYHVFDLLYLNGWDLRPCAVLAIKNARGSLGLARHELAFADLADRLRCRPPR